MADRIYNIFCILHGKNPIKRVPKQIFIEKDYTKAKLYFQGWIYGELYPQDYVLYKIGEVNQKMEIENQKIFICGGFEVSQKQKKDNTKEKIEQVKLEFEKYKTLEEEMKDKTQTEIIEKLFEGHVI